jgi:N-acyl-D-amino-acid deacylase
MNFRPTLLSFALLLWSTFVLSGYDLLLRNGRVIDGTGNPARFADIAIRDQRIVALGKLKGDAKREIDLEGLIVAPGFIDVHTHAEDILGLPEAENFVRMGVTTLVLGNCGSSKVAVAEFFAEVEKTRVSANVATLIGQGSVRGQVMGGSFARTPTDEETDRMKALVRQGMIDGALGLSTGLIYLPGTFSKTEELIGLAQVVAEFDGIYASHMRNEGHRIFEALDELFRIAREGGTRGHISHLKLSGRSAWHQAERVLAAIEKARAEGLDITHDQYAYTASSTGLSQLVPQNAREGGRTKFMERMRDPARKETIVAEMKKFLQTRGQEDYGYAVIASFKKDPALNGFNVREAAMKKRGSDALDEQIELILEIEAEGGASAVFHGMNEEDLQTFMRHPNTMIASDSGVRRWQQGVPHPRGYGNNARVLGRYVRELELLRLEEAIRRMTSLPATTFGLADRGVVREGAWADLVVFDPGKVRDHAGFDDPHHYASGFRLVLVNGEAVVEDDGHTGARPGRVVRRRSPNERVGD